MGRVFLLPQQSYRTYFRLHQSGDLSFTLAGGTARWGKATMGGSRAGLIRLLELPRTFLGKRNSRRTVKDEYDVKICAVGRRNNV
jgi:hypothetical protein